jgi:hypothetical protein
MLARDLDLSRRLEVIVTGDMVGTVRCNSSSKAAMVIVAVSIGTSGTSAFTPAQSTIQELCIVRQRALRGRCEGERGRDMGGV